MSDDVVFWFILKQMSFFFCKVEQLIQSKESVQEMSHLNESSQ